MASGSPWAFVDACDALSAPPLEVSDAVLTPRATSPPLTELCDEAKPVVNIFDIRWSTPSAVSLAGSPLVSARVSSGLRLKPRSAFAGSDRSWLRNAASLIARCTTSLILDIQSLLRHFWPVVRCYIPPAWPVARPNRTPAHRQLVNSPAGAPFPLLSASLKLGQLDRIASRPADSAVERIVDDERAQRLVPLAAEHIHDERVELRVVAAHAPTAEATRPERRPLARPAVQPPSLPRPPRPGRPRDNAPFWPET